MLFLTVGLNYGIDFTGGTLIEVRVTTGPADLAEMRAKLDALHLGEPSLQAIRQPAIRRADPHAAAAARRRRGADDRRSRRCARRSGRMSNIAASRSSGPSVGSELIRAGVLATVLALGAIMVYVWFRFEWQFGVGAMLSTLHDVITTVGLFAIFQLEFNLTTLAAILTIAGYSINDTVVIYDRVRESMRKYRTMPFRDLINLALNETLSRTILTVSDDRAGGAVAAVPRRRGAARVQHRDAVGHRDRHLFVALYRRAAALLRAAEPARDRQGRRADEPARRRPAPSAASR